MSSYVIRGGKPLFGAVEIQGSKNSAVAIILACIAVEGEVVLHRVPCITDVLDCIEIVRYVGGRVEWLSGSSLYINCVEVEYKEVPARITERIRASTYLMGAFLGRFGRCPLMKSGGCSLGERPIDLHMDVLGAIGARHGVTGELCLNRVSDAKYSFPRVTVGGTVNAIVAAACGCGECVLKKCAKEPHVCDVVRFLNECGADIEGVGSDCLVVRGVGKLRGCEFTLSGDMIEAGTYLLAGVATGGAVTVNGVCTQELSALCNALEYMGLYVEKNDLSIAVSGLAMRSASVETGEYPLFPTDLHPQMVAFMGCAPGCGFLRENVFGGDRFKYLTELGKQGLVYSVEGNGVTVRESEYVGAKAYATDLRGGAANVIAALRAEGESVIGNAEFVERGYSDFVLKLRALGADVSYGDL